MNKIILDIETVGYDFNLLSESQQEFILRYAEREKDDLIREEKIEEAKRYLSLYPFTAKVVALGMLNIETENSLVLFEGNGSKFWEAEQKKIKYEEKSENDIINLFWEYVSKCEQIITFNGRNFDLPFLILRSALLKIKPTRNLIGSRYNNKNHIDLLDKFTLYGLVRKFNIDFYCKAFGIQSPKSKGISGMDVKELYNAGRIEDIAIYCGEDVRATYELYKVWNDYLNI